jgi:hypothetical protein
MYSPAPFWQLLALVLQPGVGRPKLGGKHETARSRGAAGIRYLSSVFTGENGWLLDA